MEIVYLLIGGAIGVLIGIVSAAAYWRPKLVTLDSKFSTASVQLQTNKSDLVQLRETFRSLAADALKDNSESFLTLARENLGRQRQETESAIEKKRESIDRLIKPVGDTLKKVGEQLGELEKVRLENYTTLKTEVLNLSRQTATLSDALQRPTVRGRWGEMQLRRVVEIAGMTEYCDFDEQVTVGNPNDSKLRPDMVINLAGGKQIVVDSKVPLDAYMRAMNAETDTERNDALADHLKQTRVHITSLSSKSYQDQFESTPDMAVMFIPADSTFMAALDQDAELIEWAAQRGVLLASPLTLIAVLKAVAVGWREEQLAENARAISSLGQDLYQRISVFTTRFSALGRRLNSTVTGFNEAAGSLDGRVLPSARRFHELGVIPTEEELSVSDIETTARELRAPESRSLVGGEEE